MWHIVWPGVSRHSSSTVLPTLITSPAFTPRSTPAMREPGVVVRDHLGAGRRDHGRVAAGVVVVLVGVEDLRDLPALVLGRGQALLVVQRIDRQRLAGLGAGDQVVVVAVGVAGPDALDDHGGVLQVAAIMPSGA